MEISEREQDTRGSAVTGRGQRETDRGVNRKLRLLKSCGLFGNDRSGAFYERATSPKDLEAAYRLVHDVYLETGYIKPHPMGLRLRHFECSPDTATFVAKTASCTTIGVISVVMDSPDFGLPSDHVYKDEIDIIRKEGGVVCEISNQAVLPEYRRKGPSTELMRCAFAYAFSQGTTDLICAVSPPVVPFYEMMEFKKVGDVKSYSKQIDDPVVLMREAGLQIRGGDVEQSHDLVYRVINEYFYKNNPYFSYVSAWNVQNQYMFSEQFEIASLFGKCPEVIENETYRKGLKRRLGAIYELSREAAGSGKNVGEGELHRGRVPRRLIVNRERFGNSRAGLRRNVRFPRPMSPRTRDRIDASSKKLETVAENKLETVANRNQTVLALANEKTTD